MRFSMLVCLTGETLVNAVVGLAVSPVEVAGAVCDILSCGWLLEDEMTRLDVFGREAVPTRDGVDDVGGRGGEFLRIGFPSGPSSVVGLARLWCPLDAVLLWEEPGGWDTADELAGRLFSTYSGTRESCGTRFNVFGVT